MSHRDWYNFKAPSANIDDDQAQKFKFWRIWTANHTVGFMPPLLPMIYRRWVVDQIIWFKCELRFQDDFVVDRPSSTMVIFYFDCINKFRPNRQLRFFKWIRKRVNLSYKFKYRPLQVVRIEVQLDKESKVVMTLPNTWFRRTRKWMN